MSSTRTQSIGQETWIGAERYADLIVEDYPHPGKSFQRTELETTREKRLLRNLVDRGIINVVGENGDYLVYQVDRSAHEIAKTVVDERDPLLPCGHSGLVSLRDGRGFICSYRGCGKIHSREDVEAWRAEE